VVEHLPHKQIGPEFKLQYRGRKKKGISMFKFRTLLSCLVVFHLLMILDTRQKPRPGSPTREARDIELGKSINQRAQQW
jgi:hypothetical protein